MIFSEEFNLDGIDWDPTHGDFGLPISWRALTAYDKEYEKIKRNVEELQMRLNLTIEADKERLWDDDKTPERLDLESILGHQHIPTPFDDDYDAFSAANMIYSLFYNHPKYFVFDPHAVMFKS